MTFFWLDLREMTRNFYSSLFLFLDIQVCFAAEECCGTLHLWYIHPNNGWGEKEHSWLCNNEIADPQPAGNFCTEEIKSNRIAKDLISMLIIAHLLRHIHPQITLSVIKTSIVTAKVAMSNLVLWAVNYL